MHAGRVAVSLLALVLLATPTIASVELEGFEDDSPSGQGVPPSDGAATEGRDAKQQAPSTWSLRGAEFNQAAHPARPAPQPASLLSRLGAGKEDWTFEIMGLVLLVLYVYNFFVGRAANEKIAVAWAKAFCREGSIFERNFSLMGATESRELLLKDSMSTFRLWASGRRYCSGMLATLQLRKRQDLLALGWGLVSAAEDVVEVEVTMNDTNMGQMVLLIAAPRVGKDMAKQLKDVEQYCKRMEPARDKLPTWPADKLGVWTEQGSVFYSLMVDQIMELLFSRAAFEPLSKYFRYAHWSSEHLDESGSADAEAKPKKVLRFCFALPPVDRMEDVSRLMTFVTLAIDVVGQYKLTPEQAKRAQKGRSEAERAAFKERQEERMEELARKKAEAKMEEAERIKKLNPEARLKYMAKRERQEAKKQVKVKMLK